MRKLLLRLVLISHIMVAQVCNAACTAYNIDAGTGLSSAYLNSSTIYGYIASKIPASSCSVSPDQKSLKLSINDTLTSISLGQEYAIQTLGGTAFQNSMFKGFSLKLDMLQGRNDQICLNVQSIYGIVPLLCADITPTASSASTTAAQDSCVESAACTMSPINKNSKVILSMSGSAVQCAIESANSLFFGSRLCAKNYNLAGFLDVVAAAKLTLTALLTLYIIYYGAQIALNPGAFNGGDALFRVIKLLIIVYCTIGFSSFSIFLGKISYSASNGMIDIVLPFLQRLSTDLANMVLSAASSSTAGLCNFDPATYPAGYSYYALFDAIDCRVGYFLGYGLLYSSFQANGYVAINALGIFKVISSMFLTQPVWVICNIAFLYLFLNVLFVQFVGAFIVNNIMLCFMVFISPFIIPLVLFGQTKNVFTKWLSNTLSFALQPVVMAAFISVMLGLYDKALYGNCQFQASTQNINGKTLTSFNITPPTTDDQCTGSYGYQLYRLYSGQDWSSRTTTFMSLDSIRYNSLHMLNMIRLLVISAVIYKLAQGAGAFAAAITGGMNIGLQNEGGGEGGAGGVADPKADDSLKAKDGKAQDSIKSRDGSSPAQDSVKGSGEASAATADLLKKPDADGRVSRSSISIGGVQLFKSTKVEEYDDKSGTFKESGKK